MSALSRRSVTQRDNVVVLPTAEERQRKDERRARAFMDCETDINELARMARLPLKLNTASGR